MDLNWLQDILCLENTRSFTQAAQERNVTQSALSRRVKALEAWIGSPLIDRSSYPIRLTAAGESFLPVARQLLAQLLDARDALHGNDGFEGRVFRIAAPHSIASNFLAARLGQMHRATPELQTRVFSDNAAVCFDLLSQGVCEFLLSYRYPPVATALDDLRFVSTDVGTERLIAVAQTEMAARRGWALPGRPEQPLSYLAYDESSFLGAVVAHLLTSRPGRPVLRTCHTDAFAEAIKAMCRDGAGIAWLPQSMVAEDLAEGRLCDLGGADWTVELKLTLSSERDLRDADARRIWAALGGPPRSGAGERAEHA